MCDSSSDQMDDEIGSSWRNNCAINAIVCFSVALTHD